MEAAGGGDGVPMQDYATKLSSGDLFPFSTPYPTRDEDHEPDEYHPVLTLLSYHPFFPLTGLIGLRTQ